MINTTDYPDFLLEDARDEFLADSFATSLWLCDHLKQPEDQTTFTDGFWHLDMSNATVDQLWTLMLTGSDKQCLAARHELRERMTDTSAKDIEARIPDMLANRSLEEV